MKLSTYAFACLLLFATVAVGQSTVKHISINKFHLQTQPNLHEFDALKSVYLQDQYGDYFFAYLQFENLPTSVVRKQISDKTGILFFDYLPENAYYTAIPASINIAELYNFKVRGIYRVLPEYKVSPKLTSGSLPEYALNADNTIDLNIVYYKSLKQSDIMDRLASLGVLVSNYANWVNVLKINVPVTSIQEIASLPFVQYVEPEYPPSVPDNYESRTDHRNNFIANDYATGLHYNGEGVWVAVQDDGSIGPHIDFQGRVEQSFVDGDDEGDHGDHVSGIVGGAGNLDPKGRGNAFGAMLKIYHAYDNGVQSWEGWYDIPNAYVNPGVTITSTSYSDLICNEGYNSLSQFLDQEIWDYPNLMHVFSAGNNGTGNCGPISKWYNITGGHKTGKNVLTVANVNKDDELNSSSSRGPVADGRMKPEISAVGTDVYSTYGPNAYSKLTGTSMSCPAISGTLAIFTQIYKEFNGGVNPPSGLLKAIIMNTTDDLGNPGPDYKHGFGRVNARRGYETLKNKHYISDIADQGYVKSFNIDVPEDVRQLRVLIYWNDYPATLGAYKDIVNDLQLEVTDPSNTTFNPWVLNPLPNKDTLDSPAKRGIDTLNNHEQVTIDDPSAGVYQITVKGNNVPQGPQEFFITYEYLYDEVTLIYPTGGEPWVPGEKEKVRWDSYGTAGTFTLELSSDGGATWTPINSNIDAAARLYDYTVPTTAVTSGNYMMRISRGSVSDQSDTTFSIIPVPTNLHINSVCPTHVDFEWNAVTTATGYEVYVLGDKYMQSIGTTTATSFEIPGLNINNSDWISVRALGAEGAKGRRAKAIEKDPGLANCVLNTDIGITVVDPPSSTYNSCMGLDAVPVTVTIQNDGLNAVSNFSVNLQIDANPIITETYTGTIAPGTSGDYTFSNPVDLSVAGTYNINSWITLGTDENPWNDTLGNVITVLAVSSVTLPFYENFESFSLCETSNSCELGICPLSNGWLNVTNGAGDNIDWRTNSGPTPGNNTGPDADFDPGSSSGKYLYLEAGNCKFKEGFLYTPCIDLTTAALPMLSFAYHMYGTDMGDLHVDAFVNGSWTTDLISPIVGNQGNQWKADTIDLTAWKGNVVTIRFRGKTGNSGTSDMALDAIGAFDKAGTVAAAFSTSGQLCVDETITFTSTSTGNISSYSWDFGADANPATASTAGPHDVVYSSEGTKTVTLTVDNGVTSDTEISNITVSALPVSSFGYTNDGLTFTFTNSSSGASSYLWDFGDGNTSTSLNPVHTFTTVGTYTVTLSVTGTCGTNSSTQTIVVTGIEATQIVNGVFIYPNPSDGMFYAEMQQQDISNAMLSVHDVTGKKLFEISQDRLIAEYPLAIDLRNYPEGIYFLRISRDGQEVNYKLIR